MTEDEYNITMEFLIATMPPPERFVVVATEDIKAWRDAGLAVLSDFFADKGIGFYGKGALVLAGPVLLSDVIKNAIPDIGAEVETGYYSAFGMVVATLSDGREVQIDPVGRVIHVAKQIAPSPRMELVLGFVSDFMGALEDQADDPIKDTAGRPLLLGAATTSGALEYGQVYRFKTSFMSGRQPEPENLERLALIDAIILSGPYEIMIVPAPDPNAPVAAEGEAWGDDWGE